MNILLLGGMWLTASAWAAVANALNAAGHNAIAPVLPQHATATLRDQLDAALAALPAGPSLVVGHSAACSLAWMVADAAPTQGVVLIGGFPKAHGEAYFPHLEPIDGWVKFPGWAEFAGPDSADLTAAQQQAVEAAMVPVPASVTQSRVELTNPARYETPVTIICPEFSPADVREWTVRGFLPELSPTARLLDFGSGHWPMASCPDELARVLDELAGELAAAKA